MKRMLAVICIMLLVFVAGCQQQDRPNLEATPEPVPDHMDQERDVEKFNDVDWRLIDVSMVNLIAHPERYHGKVVRLDGIGNIGEDGRTLALCRGTVNPKDTMWLEFDPELAPDTKTLEQYNGKVILVEGTFNKDNTGDSGLCSGCIENITRYECIE